MRMSLATKFSLKPFAKPNSGLASTESNSAASAGVQTSFGSSNSSNESAGANASCANDATAVSLLPSTTSRTSNQADVIGTSFSAKQSLNAPESKQNEKPSSLPPTPSTFQPQGFGQSRLFGVQEDGQANAMRMTPLASKKMFATPTVTHSSNSASQHQLGSSGVPMESSRASSFPSTPTSSIASEIRSKATTMMATSNNHHHHNNNNSERSLVLLPQPGGGGYAQEDPFSEVTRTIHAQNRKIRELELQLKEQMTISDQLRARIDDSQEVSKKAEDELASLRDKVARSENTLSHKEVELNDLRTRIGQLETDKFRMMNENSVLSKTIEDQKKRFIAELKKSTETILVLQNIRGKTSPSFAGNPSNTPDEKDKLVREEEKDTEEKSIEIEPTKPVQEASKQSNATHDIKAKEEEDKHKTNLLEQALIEAENNFEDLKRWYSIAAGIISQCEPCSIKFNQEQVDIQETSEHQPMIETQIQSENKMEVETNA